MRSMAAPLEDRAAKRPAHPLARELWKLLRNRSEADRRLVYEALQKRLGVGEMTASASRPPRPRAGLSRLNEKRAPRPPLPAGPWESRRAGAMTSSDPNSKIGPSGRRCSSSATRSPDFSAPASKRSGSDLRSMFSPVASPPAPARLPAGRDPLHLAGGQARPGAARRPLALSMGVLRVGRGQAPPHSTLREGAADPRPQADPKGVWRLRQRGRGRRTPLRRSTVKG